MNQKRLTMGLLISLVALVSGISYTYFTATFQNLGVRETSITAAEMGSLKLTSTEAVAYYYKVRPSLFLNERVYIAQGQGTPANPYVLSLN